MSLEPTGPQTAPDHHADATRRQRFGLLLASGLGLIAAGFSYVGTRDTWVTADRRPDSEPVTTAGEAPDPAWDVPLPVGPHRDEFETSCLICHSARLPLGQPKFPRQKWVEIVHKMVAVYGAPLTPEDESEVVDYLLAVKPPAS